MKKFFALVLCLVLVLAGMPVGAEGEQFDVRVELLSFNDGASFDETSGYTSIFDNDVTVARLDKNTGDHQVESGTSFSIAIDQIADGYFVEYRIFDTGSTPSDDFLQLESSGGTIAVDSVTAGTQIDIRIYRNYTVSVNVGENGAIIVNDVNYLTSESAHQFVVKGGDNFYAVVVPDEGYNANEYTKDGMGELLSDNEGVKSISLNNVNADTIITIPFVQQEPGGDDSQPQTYRVTVEVIGQGTVRGRTADDEPGFYPLEVVNNTGDSISGSIEIPEGSPSLELTWMGADGYAIDQTYQIVQPADGQTPPVNENIPGDNKIAVNGEMDTRVIITFVQGGGGGEPGPGDQPPPMEPFDLTINKPTNGTVYYYEAPDSESLTELTAASVLFEQLEQSMIIYLKPNAGYKVTAVQHLSAEMTAREDCSYLLSYDPNIMLNDEQGLVAVPLEFWDDTEVFFEFSPLTAADMAGIQVAILNSDDVDDAAAKQAIRRELGYYGFDIPVSRISVSPAADQTSDNGVPYKTRSFTAMGYTSTVYIVDHVSNGVFISDGTYSDGTTGSKVYIYAADDLSNASQGNQNFSVQPIADGTLDLFGPYKLGYIGTFSPDTEDALSLAGNYNYRMDISRYFGRVALHIANSADESILNESGLSVNWYMMTLIQEDALAVQINTSAAIGGFQGAHGLDLDNVADLSSGDAEINMFFGNDTVYIDRPMNDAGDIETMSTPEVDHPGYTIRMVNGSIEVFFKSNFYDRLTIPITITRQDGTVVVSDLTVIRTGIQFSQRDLSSRENVFHGTKYGSEINFSGDDSYFVVASYLIPDFGDTLPYGLLVTRTYDDGSTETEIVRNPIDSPPEVLNALRYENGVYYYNNGVPGEGDMSEYNANVADYMVFAGDENGNIPKTINVLVLKADPASVSTGSFGGFFFGSGSGVEWDRSN